MNDARRPSLRPLLFRPGRCAVALALLAGCAITAPDGRAGKAIELERARQRWNGAALHDYEFDYQLVCFCAPETTEQVHITVRRDSIVSVTRTRDAMPALARYARWPRVDELFDDVRGRIEQRVAHLDVSYDPELGYPRSIVVDVAEMAVDDESRQVAGSLRPLR